MELELKVEKLTNEHKEAILENRVAFENMIKLMFQGMSTLRATTPPDHQFSTESWGAMNALKKVLDNIEKISQEKIKQNIELEDTEKED